MKNSMTKIVTVSIGRSIIVSTLFIFLAFLGVGCKDKKNVPQVKPDTSILETGTVSSEKGTEAEKKVLPLADIEGDSVKTSEEDANIKNRLKSQSLPNTPLLTNMDNEPHNSFVSPNSFITTSAIFGRNRVCAIISKKVVCLGGRDSELNIVPYTFIDPQQVLIATGSMGASQTCVLDLGVLLCWGRRIPRIPEATIPIQTYKYELGNIQQVTGISRSTNSYFTCFLFKNGTVNCLGRLGLYGSNKYDLRKVEGIFDTEHISNAIQLSSGDYHSCVLIKNKLNNSIKCWTTDSNIKMTPPSAGNKNPLKLFSSGDTSCAIYTGDEIKCWARDKSESKYNYIIKELPQDLKNISSISMHDNDSACAVTEDNIKCWGYNSYKKNMPSNLKNITQISMGWGYICALANNKLHCWLDDRDN